ncbi:variant-specific surface protein VSP4A1-like [Ruditapes philippinarum]|uniref:variant-specific surface protein VSP4A1-like n=1 Tax=Ruditapes philippinarum TaxID=129788 RepID=UPI00295B4A7A|nr:variant-specific surface protein VSP4A1-like [Ruditapes philippinarum]
MRNIDLIASTLCMFQLVNNTTGGIDEQCLVDCACCIDRVCGPGHYFSNECYIGCIEGHRGARCSQLCSHNCTKCTSRADSCTACYDGYYPGSARDCTSKCLPGCKTCTSETTCTSCKEGYYNAAGQSYCNCAEHCYCENNQCISCKEGYYDTSNLCNSICPGNCVMCSPNTNC